MELCTQFAASRITVREAMRKLSDMGLVSRTAGVGTRVRAKYSTPRYLHSITSISDIFQYAKALANPRLISASEIVANEDQARLLRCKPGHKWVTYETVRAFAENHLPMAHVHGYLQPEYAGIVKAIPTHRKPTYLLLEKLYGEQVVEVQQEFMAKRIDGRASRLLSVKAGQAGLYVFRHFFGTGHRLLLVTVSLYPSDRYSYAMQLRYDGTAESSSKSALK